MLNLQKILQRILSKKVECILVGGFAAVAHGSSTLTRDLDVCFSFHPENIRKLIEALEDIHPHMRAGPGILPLEHYTVERLSQLNNLYVKTDWGDLDLLGQIKGIGNFEEVSKKTIEIEIFGYPCRILDIDSLIKAKEAMDRPKDKQVVLELQVIREKNSKK